MAEDKILADGMFFKVRDNQPEWVIGKCSIKVETFIEFLRLHENNGYVNLDILTLEEMAKDFELIKMKIQTS
ncbi:MAG TPA: hypothetical protein VFM79_08975 [Pelobium sp.]|nr:hypothetical protein [Pelobium sp.]